MGPFDYFSGFLVHSQCLNEGLMVNKKDRNIQQRISYVQIKRAYCFDFLSFTKRVHIW